MQRVLRPTTSGGRSFWKEYVCHEERKEKSKKKRCLISRMFRMGKIGEVDLAERTKGLEQNGLL